MNFPAIPLADALHGPLAVLALAVALVLAALAVWLAQRGEPALRQPYLKRTALFSAEERALYRRLREAAGEDYAIFGKIPADEIIVPKTDASAKAVECVAGRYFDFVLCDPRSLAVACVVVLDDSEPGEDALATLCLSLGLPCVRLQPQVDYAAAWVRQRLRAAMAAKPAEWAEDYGRKEPRISNLDDLRF
ncbi:MAG: DUF2726 domain-containing protein [Candidatus Methylumidiphilus sp.]